MGGQILAPHFSCLFPFFFFAFSFLHLSSTIVTIHLLLPLDFSSSPCHFLSKKITFLSFSTFLHSSPSIFFQILVFLAIFLHTHFCETHFHTPLFFAQKCHPLPMGPLFLLFMERNIIHHLNGMVRRSFFKTPRPKLHIPTWTSWWVFLCFFVRKNVISMFDWKFDVETLSFYYVLLLEFGALHGWPCCNLGFGAFLNCCIFWSWFNLNNVWWVMNFGNVGNLWCCWMNFDLNFGDIEVVRNLWCRLGWIHLWCMWEILLACVKFISWTWQNFVGMEIFFCGYGKILWVSDFGLWNIFVRYVMLDHGNFCDCDFGHGKFSVVILIMENFWLWFWSWGFFGRVYNVIFGVGIFWTNFGMGIFLTCDFGMGICWTCDF